MAGINAHLVVNEKDPLILQRDEAYIGVLIDDLVSKGTEEPYRMFTSRAEYRILLRQDNADLRLTELSYKLGFAEAERMKRVEEKQKATNEIIDLLKNSSIEPQEIDNYLVEKGTTVLPQKMKLEKIVLRPQIGLLDMTEHVAAVKTLLGKYEDEFLEQAEISVKYEGYIEKEKELVRKMQKVEKLKLKPDFDYNSIPSLSIEARQKLNKIKPETVGQAGRISGVSPADIAVLMVYLSK